MFVDKGIEPVEVFCKVCLFPRLRVIFINFMVIFKQGGYRGGGVMEVGVVLLFGLREFRGGTVPLGVG